MNAKTLWRTIAIWQGRRDDEDLLHYRRRIDLFTNVVNGTVLTSNLSLLVSDVIAHKFALLAVMVPCCLMTTLLLVWYNSHHRWVLGPAVVAFTEQEHMEPDEYIPVLRDHAALCRRCGALTVLPAYLSPGAAGLLVDRRCSLRERYRFWRQGGWQLAKAWQRTKSLLDQ